MLQEAHTSDSANPWVSGFRMPEVYVVSRSDDRWVVERQEAKRATSTHDTKKEAVKRAMDLAERKGAMLLVYKSNGEHQKTYDFRQP